MNNSNILLHLIYVAKRRAMLSTMPKKLQPPKGLKHKVKIKYSK